MSKSKQESGIEMTWNPTSLKLDNEDNHPTFAMTQPKWMINAKNKDDYIRNES